MRGGPLRKGSLLVLGGVVLAIGVVVCVGLLLPEDHHATVSRVVRASPEEVWAAITGVEAFPAWRPEVKEVRRLEDRGGLPAWVERGPGGSMTLQVTELDAPRRLVTRIADQGIPFGGTWTYEVDPGDGGTRVRITEDGEIYNPVFRFVSRFVLGYDGTILAYLDALERRVSTSP
jgi:uncharacterized protein YndB with AHSA1/START domain